MKLLKLTLVTALTSVVMATTAFAGTWQTGTGANQSKWWYDNEDGSYPSNGWQWIDGNNDGIAECYYFDTEGWLLTNTTTPDNYQVNENGAWIENSTVQTQTATTDSNNTVDHNGYYEYYKTQLFFSDNPDRDNPDQEYQLFGETPVWDKVSYDSACSPRIEQLRIWFDFDLDLTIKNSSEEELFVYYFFRDTCSDEDFKHYSKFIDNGYYLDWYNHSIWQGVNPGYDEFLVFENNTVAHIEYYPSDDLLNDYDENGNRIPSPLDGKDIMIKTLYMKQ